MQVDLEHVKFWMDAIRSSDDPRRTLEAFWGGQLKSKEWLIDNLKPFVHKPADIAIYGGWVGVLASMLFQSKIPVNKIESIDIDISCLDLACTMNKLEEMQGRFRSICRPMETYPNFGDNPVAINTSAEHISQDAYEQWLDLLIPNTLIVVQSNNYKISEHCRIAESLDEFRKQCHLREAWFGELVLPLYTRYMIIGNV
jgi:hypothetical protein